MANLEYRIPIAGPVTFALFMDTGMDMAVLQSQLRLSDQQVNELNNTPFGCPTINSSATECTGTQLLKFGQYITPLPHTNYQVRMSTGAELQVILPMVNAPFRLYYAYNPLRVDTEAPAPTDQLTRGLFPAGDAGNYTFANTQATYNPSYRIREPRKTLRLTVSTTF